MEKTENMRHNKLIKKPLTPVHGAPVPGQDGPPTGAPLTNTIMH